MIRVVFVTLACLMLALGKPAAYGGDLRFFTPTPGYVRVRDLPPGFRGRVVRIDFDIKDAFEGAAVHSEAERSLYAWGDKLHIKTRPSTLRRRLLFRVGDTVTDDLLRETQKRLRDEQFLADAIIEVKPLADSGLAVKVTTYDQWTTVPAFSVSRDGGKWIWWVGPVESNLLGTGQQVGFYIGHDLERDSRLFEFNNTAFTPLRLQLSTQYSWLSDGYSYAVSVAKPLLARTDQWAFSLSTDGIESAQNLYLSGNDLDRLQDQGRLPDSEQSRLGVTNLLGQWTRVDTHHAYAGVTRSFGYDLKSSITPFYQREDRYLHGGIFDIADTVIWHALGRPFAAPGFDARHDELLGVSLSLYEYAYKTVYNFENLKWGENLETGWRLSSSVAKNQTALGATNPDWQFTHTAVYNDTWLNALFLNSNASVSYFLSPQGDVDNGSTASYAEFQWKPVALTASVATAQFNDLFATTASQQLYLGEEAGLNGFPNFYYAGKATVLFTAEQRLFPPFELGTVVPAFSVFCNAGNAYASNDEVDLGNLHYALGLSLLLGATRSVQKVVNHINVTFPLGEKNLSTLTWGIRASKSL